MSKITSSSEYECFNSCTSDFNFVKCTKHTAELIYHTVSDVYEINMPSAFEGKIYLDPNELKALVEMYNQSVEKI